MKSVPPLQSWRRTASIFFILLLLTSHATRLPVVAQTAATQTQAQSDIRSIAAAGFRLERLPVEGGAELLTVFGSLDGLHRTAEPTSDVPLVSVLRDTLGDQDPANDQLRYLWMLTYTSPTSKQRIASAIPFFYQRIGSKKRASQAHPLPIIDLAATEREVWDKFFWTALQYVLLDSYAFPVKASTRTYRRNLEDYRKAHIIRALAILSLYAASQGGPPAFSDSEMRDIQARLMLTEKSLGGLVDDIYLQRVYEKQTTAIRDVRGHNWELLRQRAEAESLYFEPLELPDGSATHALVWVARSDLETNRDRRFESRFLNIKNPWQDEALRQWKGYTETRYFDAENRPVQPGTPGARAQEMIPLALYGLDHPKIPIMLVDFRSSLNPKGREMSRRVLRDVASNILALSRFGDLPYFLGRTIYSFVTGRRGIDLNQPSRLRSYSQLKLLLSLDASLDPQLQNEINRRLERAALNPLENDLQAEEQLARAQYASLLAYARRPDGLPARLSRDRRAEMVPLKHDRLERTLFRMANIVSFGLYTHRESANADLRAQLDTKRSLAYHVRFLREVAHSSPQIEVVWNMEDVRRSLRYVAENGALADSKVAAAVARIFARTQDAETRQLCLNSLRHINNETAKAALLRISKDPNLEARWRTISEEYLLAVNRQKQPIAPAETKASVSTLGQ